MDTPDDGFRRTRIVTGALVAFGVVGVVGGTVLAYSDTQATAITATTDETKQSSSPSGGSTAPNAQSITTSPAAAPKLSSGSSTSHARSAGS
ncbi:hypothetical protein [Rhodococcus erythropolis]|uniref:Uncharacterized protein n=1 Tax=Rhodococcus erythropolis TaxID=1833 RepID=A0AAX3ZZI2_RHOER|nr:hypothetical protein [Rhodococcus erythropolis]WMN01944.1 hypothetical protein QIE55_32135 [Rhodococcus erythropolis]